VPEGGWQRQLALRGSRCAWPSAGIGRCLPGAVAKHELHQSALTLISPSARQGWTRWWCRRHPRGPEARSRKSHKLGCLNAHTDNWDWARRSRQAWRVWKGLSACATCTSTFYCSKPHKRTCKQGTSRGSRGFQVIKQTNKCASSS
jgi:hypothetical protein